jgi:hypothetical protein
MGVVGKKHIAKLGCEKYFYRVTYRALLEMPLLMINIQNTILETHGG